MKLESTALTVIFVLLLITRPVESARGKKSKDTGKLKPKPKLSTISNTLETLQMGDRADTSCEKPKEKREKKSKKRVSKSLVDQNISSKSLKVIDHFASSSEVQHFIEAVQKGDMETALDVFYGDNSGLKKYCGKYLVSLESPILVKLLNSAIPLIRSRLLRVLLVHADQQQLIDDVFAGLKSSNKFLSYVAFSAESDLLCTPQGFTHLLWKMNDREGQEWAVKKGVQTLFKENKTECLDPLLDALRERTLLNANLEDVAIREAFKLASHHKDGRMLFVKRYYDHPAIPAKDYSTVLYRFYRKGGKNKILFRWLLDGADCQDLEVIKGSDEFSGEEADFQQAVNQALKAVRIESRHESGRKRRMATTRVALEEHLPKVIEEVVFGYIEIDFNFTRVTLLNPSNAIINLNSTTQHNMSFADLKRWIQGSFSLDKYDSAQLKALRVALHKSPLDIRLYKIHKLGSMTHVLALHDPFELIPPNIPIAIRYDINSLESENTITLPKYSTIITNFEHEGTTCCLVLSLNIPIE